MNSKLRTTNGLLILFFIFAALGLADAVYLAITYFTGTPLSCTIIEGCNEVAASPYSQVAGVPISTFGIPFYTISLVGALFYWIMREQVYVTLLAFFTMLGFFASAYFTYLQFFVIEAVCLYCIASAATATILFVIAAVLRARHVKKESEVTSEPAQ